MTEKKDTWWDALRFAVILLAIIIPFRLFVAQPFIVHGQSMDDTFHQNDYLIVDELSYLFRNPERGEVVIFKNPLNNSQYFIKRIIGLPGETVNIVNGKVTIIQPGKGRFTLEEPYLGSDNQKDAYRKLDTGEYFVMGDNREVSWDSRYWGALKQEKIRGRAFVRLFPFTKVDYLPGLAHYANDINNQ